MPNPIALKSNAARLMVLLHKTKTALYLVASVSVFSCQENNQVNPELTQSHSSTIALSQARISALKKYTLTKFGEQKLMYYPDGRIKGYVYPSYGLTATYSYNFAPGTMYASGSIDVVLQAPSPKVNINKTYWFNDTGHCYKYKEVDHQPSGDITLLYILAYNAKGQLTDCLQWLNGNDRGREHYDYNADGDLIKITSLNPQLVIYRTVILSYTDANGGGLVDDLYPVNSEWTELYEGYLPYFGKPSKHLVKSVVETLTSVPKAARQVYYSYVLNADGYVTQRNSTAWNLGGAAYDTKQYEYEVTLSKIPN